MELKESIKKHLEEKKEKERLERVESNSKLKKSIIYTNGGEYDKQVMDHLDSEGIKYEKVIVPAFDSEEMRKIMAITNINRLPAILINNNFLMPDRDFNSPQQVVAGIQHFGSSNFKQQEFEEKTFEHIRTLQFSVMKQLTSLEQKLTPLLTTLQEIMSEDDDE